MTSKVPFQPKIFYDSMIFSVRSQAGDKHSFYFFSLKVVSWSKFSSVYKFSEIWGGSVFFSGHQI